MRHSRRSFRNVCFALVVTWCALIAGARATTCPLSTWDDVVVLSSGSVNAEYTGTDRAGLTYNAENEQSVTMFMSKDEYVTYDGTSYTLTTTASACDPPMPPAPTPPPPAPPAMSSISGVLTLGGLNTDDVQDSTVQTKLIAGIGSYYQVPLDKIIIVSVCDANNVCTDLNVAGTPLARRRRSLLAASPITVNFKIEAPDMATGQTIQTAVSGDAGVAADESALLSAIGLARITSLGLSGVTPLAAPPPSPPAPPPLCGNGVFDADNPDGEDEQCDQGFGVGVDLPEIWGCVTKCTIREGWVCNGKYFDANEVELGIDYGVFNDDPAGPAQCNCSNPAGTYATSRNVTSVDEACLFYPGTAVFPTCIYPVRCLANGGGCVEGSEGAQCKTCSIGYYKSGDSCEKCGDNTLMNIALGSIFVAVFGVAAFKTAEKLGNTAISIIKNMLNSLQFFSISFSVDIEWPDFIVKVGEWFKAFNFNIEFVAPECVAEGGISWATVFWSGTIIFPGALGIFLYLQDKRVMRNYAKTVGNIHSETVTLDDGEVTNNYWIEQPWFLGYFGKKVRWYEAHGGEKIVAQLQKQYRSRASLKSFAVLCMTVMYLPVVRLCLQAYDCTETTEGIILDHDAKIFCTDPEHIVAQTAASVILGVVGIGMPMVIVWRVRAIRISGKLDDAQTIDIYGALYDVYRRPDLTLTDKLEIAQTAKDLQRQASHAKHAEGHSELRKSASMKSKSRRKHQSDSDSDGSKSSRSGSKSGGSDDDGSDHDGDDKDDKVISKATQEILEEVAKAEEEKAQAEVDEEGEPIEGEEDESEAGKRSSLKRVLSKKLGKTFKRSASTKARERAAKMPWRDRFALYYLSVEMFQKLTAILGGSPAVTEDLRAYGLTFVFTFSGIFLIWAQPWRIMTLGFGKFRLKNTLNRVESLAMLLQGSVTVMPIMFEETPIVATTFIMMIIGGLMSVRLFMFVAERFSVRRDKRMDLTNKPADSMGIYHEQLIKYAKKGEVVRMYSTKYDFGVQRRKVKARYESTREAMLKRAREMKESGDFATEQIDALYVVANEMAHVVNELTSLPPVQGEEAETRIETSEKMLETLLEEEESRFETLEEKEENHLAVHLCYRLHAYDRARHELAAHMREYAAAEQIAELALVGGADNVMAKEQIQCTVGFGDEQLFETERRFTADDAPFTYKLMTAVQLDDVDGAIDALNEANEVFAEHMRWRQIQLDAFENIREIIDTEVDFDEKAMNAAKFELSDHEQYLTKPVMYALVEWQPLFRDFAIEKYNETLELVTQTDMKMRGFVYEKVEYVQPQYDQQQYGDQQQYYDQQDPNQLPQDQQNVEDARQFAQQPQAELDAGSDDIYDHSDDSGDEGQGEQQQTRRGMFGFGRKKNAPTETMQAVPESQPAPEQVVEDQTAAEQPVQEQAPQRKGLLGRVLSIGRNPQATKGEQVVAPEEAQQDGAMETQEGDENQGEFPADGENPMPEPEPMVQYQLVRLEGVEMPPEAEIEAALTEIAQNFANWCVEVNTRLSQAPMNERFEPIAIQIHKNISMIRDRTIQRRGRLMGMVKEAKKLSKERRGVGCFGR